MSREEVINATEKTKDLLNNYDLDGFEVLSYIRDHALTRYANNVIHQQVASNGIWTRIRAYKGKKLQTMTISYNNQIKDKIDELVNNLQISPEYPYFNGFLENQKYSSITSLGKLLSEEERGEIIKNVVDIATDKNPKIKVFGKLESIDFEYSLLNSLGIEGYHNFKFNDFKVVSILEENGNRGFGRESIGFADDKKLNTEQLTLSTVKIAEDTLNSKSIDPDTYSVILRPQALSEITAYSLFGLNGSAYQQGNSAYSDKLGEQLFSDKLTINDNPLSTSSLFNMPFDSDGKATTNSVIIDNGVPKTAFYNLLSASEFLDDKNLSTGHAVLPYSDYIWAGVMPMNLEIKAGNSNEQQMIEDTKKGLLIQTFWYSNVVNAKKGILTALTRDGLYLIENGEIKHAVKNMRYTDSFLSFFNTIDQISNDSNYIINDFAGATKTPTMKLGKLKFTGKSKH